MHKKCLGENKLKKEMTKHIKKAASLPVKHSKEALSAAHKHMHEHMR